MLLLLLHKESGHRVAQSDPVNQRARWRVSGGRPLLLVHPQSASTPRTSVAGLLLPLRLLRLLRIPETQVWDRWRLCKHVTCCCVLGGPGRSWAAAPSQPCLDPNKDPLHRLRASRRPKHKILCVFSHSESPFFSRFIYPTNWVVLALCLQPPGNKARLHLPSVPFATSQRALMITKSKVG